jgi:hypothetical protein
VENRKTHAETAECHPRILHRKTHRDVSDESHKQSTHDRDGKPVPALLVVDAVHHKEPVPKIDANERLEVAERQSQRWS